MLVPSIRSAGVSGVSAISAHQVCPRASSPQTSETLPGRREDEALALDREVDRSVSSTEVDA